MELWLQALLFGMLSALSLPVGALLGLALRPSEKVVAKLMGVGAGSLVYAVATQLYGKTLFKLLARSPGGGFGGDLPQECDEICTRLWRDVNLQVAMGLVGAVAYRGLNHLMPRCMARISPPEMARIASGKEPAAAAAAEVQGDESSLDSSDESSAPEGSDADLRPGSVEPPHGGGAAVALSMWLGLVLDGIPESIMLGFMTNGGEITFSFLLAVFVANFPEAFAGAAALQQQGMPALPNVLLWSSVFVLTGTLAMVGSLIMPVNIPAHSWLEHLSDDVTVVLQGFTGGAMLAMVATAMMPEAYHGAKSSAGDTFVFGFGASVLIDGMCAGLGRPPQAQLNR